MTYTPTMVQAQVLYKNLYRHGTVTYTGTPVAGYEPANAYDWRDFTLFRMADGESLEVTTLTGDIIDTIMIWCGSIPSAGIFHFEWWNGSIWQTSMAIGVSTTSIRWNGSGGYSITGFTKYRIRWQATGTPGATVDVRQFAIGQKLQFPIGQWNEINPPNLYQGVIVSNITSVNGSIIGRNVKRIERSGKITLEYLDPAWVRSTWDPFAIHCGRYPFFYRWHPVTYPNEVSLAFADEIVAPTNAMPPPKMRVSMPIRFLV